MFSQRRYGMQCLSVQTENPYYGKKRHPQSYHPHWIVWRKPFCLMTLENILLFITSANQFYLPVGEQNLGGYWKQVWSLIWTCVLQDLTCLEICPSHGCFFRAFGKKIRDQQLMRGCLNFQDSVTNSTGHCALIFFEITLTPSLRWHIGTQTSGIE